MSIHTDLTLLSFLGAFAVSVSSPLLLLRKGAIAITIATVAPLPLKVLPSLRTFSSFPIFSSSPFTIFSRAPLGMWFGLGVRGLSVLWWFSTFETDAHIAGIRNGKHAAGGTPFALLPSRFFVDR